MSKKAGRIVKAPGELVALGSTQSSSATKKERGNPVSTGARFVAPAEKKPKTQIATTKPTLSKKIASDVKKDTSDTGLSISHTFDIEQFYSLVSGAIIPPAQVENLLKRCAVFISNNVSKLDNTFLLSLLHLVNDRPELFHNSTTFIAFSSLLHSKPHSLQERKNFMISPVLAANVLFIAYRHKTSWPSEFIAFYIEDALGERLWVERPECSLFVYHLVKAFPTVLPPHLEEMMRSSVMKKGYKTVDESVIGFQRCLACINSNLSAMPYQESKFSADWESVAGLVHDSVRDFISRKQTGETHLQNLLKVMLLSCCFGEIRKIASEKLEFWLQNQKIVKLAQELLMTVCMNSEGSSQLETDTVSAIIKLKYASKQKHLSSHFLSCIRQLLSTNPNLTRKLIVQHVVSSELTLPSSGPRPITNISLLDAAFSVDVGWAANHMLAEYFCEVLFTSKEDPLKGLRLALRAIVNGVKSQQLNLKVFVDVLLKLTDKSGASQPVRERLVAGAADIACLSQQLLVSEMTVKAFDNFKAPDSGILGSPVSSSAMDSMSENESTIRKLQEQVSSIQLSATKWWLGLKLKAEALGTGLSSLLMMDSAASYAQRDGYPSEPERTVIFKILSNYIPSSETIFQTIINSAPATPEELHFHSFQLMDILIKLLSRNAALARRSLPGPDCFRNAELINSLLEKAIYSVDKSYGDYHQLAVTSIYWKAWKVILLAVAVNPSSLGQFFWRRHATLRYLMEMCMTGCYEFPSVAFASQSLREAAIVEEKRITEEEKKTIETLSSKLGVSLGNQVVYFDPTGPARRPSDAFLGELSLLNDQVDIGAMLCKSRDPDFLQALTTQSQTGGRPMPWLRNLILKADDALFVLPVHCVCQFVLDVEQMPQDAKTEGESEKCTKIYEQMRSLVQSAVPSKNKEFQLASQVIVNFANRLSSPLMHLRTAARSCIANIVSPPAANAMEGIETTPAPPNFRLENLLSLAVYSASEEALLKSFHEALKVELNNSVIVQYLQILSQKGLLALDTEHRENLVVDVCAFLAERRSLSIDGVNSVLPCSASWTPQQIELQEQLLNLVSTHISTILSSSQQQTQEFMDPQRHVRVSWPKNGNKLYVFHIVVVEAVCLLLALKQSDSPSSANLRGLFFNSDSSLWPKFMHVIDPDQILSRGNPFKQDWLRLVLLNSRQALLQQTVFANCSMIDLIGLVRLFGIEPSAAGRLLHELDNQAVKSPTLANEIMPAGNINSARFVLRCVQVYQKRLPNRKEPLPGSKFCECVNNLIAVKLQQLQRKPSSTAVSSREGSPSGPASPVSAPASPVFQPVVFTAMSDDAPESPPTCPPVGSILAQSDSFFSIVNFYKLITNFAQNEEEDCMQIIDEMEKELSRDIVSAQEFAFNYPGACLMLIGALYKRLLSTDSEVERFVLLCQRLSQKAGSEWRDIIKVTSVSKHLKDLDVAVASEAVSNSSDGIESPTEPSCSLQMLAPEEVEFSDERQLVKFIFLGDRWSLSDGQRLCSILFERRDAQVVWNVVRILLATPHADLPRDCRLIFKFIDAAYRKPLTFLGKEVTTAEDNDLVLGVLPDLTNTQIRSMLEIIDRSYAGNVEDVVELLSLLLAKYACKIDIFVDWVSSKLADENGSLISERMELTMKLYARNPALLSRILEKHRLDNAEFAFRSTSSLQRLEAVTDSTVQLLLLAIGSNDMRRGWTERIREATTICRRLAILHPGLVLNNIKLLAALLQGRNTAVSFPNFRSRNEPNIITNLINVFLLLQPNVFASRYSESLKIVVDSCFEIFNLYISEIDSLRSVVTKFARLLYGMLNTNLPMAVGLLVPLHHDTLTRLRQLFRSDIPELDNIDSILRSIAHIDRPADQPNAIQNDVLVTTQPDLSKVGCSGNGYSLSEVHELIERLQRRRKSIEALVSILTEIEVFTRHQPAAIVHFSPVLIDLLTEDSIQVSYKVHVLIERLLRNVPGSLSIFFDRWLAAFRKKVLSSTPPSVEVFNMFLPEAYDMCSTFPERSLLVIELMFDLISSGRLTNTETLFRCIRELNCDSMFSNRI